MKNKLNNSLEGLRKTRAAVTEKIITLLLTALGLVAALAWNDAIQTLFKVIFPKNEGIVGKFVYAIVVTSIIVLASLQLNKLSKKDK